MRYPTDGISPTTAFDGPVVDHRPEWKIAQNANASAMQDQSAIQDSSPALQVMFLIFKVTLPRTHRDINRERHMFTHSAG